LTRNPLSSTRREPLFILCPGRSFSSVVCAVIGQHPDCYGLPELNLFLGDTLGESADIFASTGRSGLQGLLRTLAQLHDGMQTEATVEAAKAWIAANRQMTSRDVFNHIAACAGDRILVEKSPSNVFGPAYLTRVIRSFPKANYLQLLRHPRSRGTSHKTAMEAEKLRAFVNQLLGLGSGLDYEAKWTETHCMIHDLGRHLPPGQMMRLNGEIFLRDLRFYLPQICEWLGIRSDEEAIAAMLRPEDSPYSCIGPANAKYGANPGFLANPALDMDRLAKMKDDTLDAPMDWNPEKRFSDMTKALASYYGYR
jgi:hypothetical protein